MIENQITLALKLMMFQNPWLIDRYIYRERDTHTHSAVSKSGARWSFSASVAIFRAHSKNNKRWGFWLVDQWHSIHQSWHVLYVLLFSNSKFWIGSLCIMLYQCLYHILMKYIFPYGNPGYCYMYVQWGYVWVTLF